MKTSTESLGPTRVKLTIEVPFEDFQPSLDKAYKTIGSQIQVPGFRKGKVPARVVDQRIGRSAVLDEAMNDVLPTWYSEALKDADLHPLSQPDIDLTKFADGEPIEITAELDVRPDIVVPDVSGLTIEVADAVVTDEEVDQQLEALREKFATFTDLDRPAAAGDISTLDLSAKDGKGNLVDGAQATELKHTVGSGALLDGLDDAVVGLCVDECTTFATELVGGELKGKQVDVTVTLRTLKAKELPELDDDFAATVGEDTLEELKEKLREGLAKAKVVDQGGEARDLLVSQIVDQVDVPLPDGLVESEVEERRANTVMQLAQLGLSLEQYLDEQGQTVEEYDAELERQVRESITMSFVLDEVAAGKNIALEGNELSNHILRRAQQLGQDPNEFIQQILARNGIEELVGEVVRAKALTSLVELVTVKDASGNVIDFAALRAEEEAQADAEADHDHDHDGHDHDDHDHDDDK